MSELAEHPIIRALHDRTNVSLDDLLKGRVHIVPQEDIPLDMWPLGYRDGCEPSRPEHGPSEDGMYIVSAALLIWALHDAPEGHLRNAALERANHINRMPDAARGRKIIGATSAGGRGRAALYEQQRHGYQPAVDELYAKNPHLSYAEIRRRVAARFKVSESTIKRYTQNPR